MYVASVARGQEIKASKFSGPVEGVSLGFCADGDRPWLAAFSPADLEPDVIALVGIAGLEIYGPFPSQPKGLIQFQIHPDVCVLDLAELVLCEVLGLVLAGHKVPVRHPVVFIGSCDDIALAAFSAHQSRAASWFLIAPMERLFSCQC